VGRLFGLVQYFGILLFIALLCFILYGVDSIWIYQQQMIFSNKASLDVYFNNLVYILGDLTLFNQKISSADTDFMILSSRAGNISDSEKVVMEYNLRNSIQMGGGINLWWKISTMTSPISML
jgi:hypothetical protein